jgi:TolB-like protein
MIDDAEGNAGGGATAAFVSYASQDAVVANAIVAACESAGLRCWIAPRDVAPGAFYADEIVGAINASGVLVLVLTANACASAHVLREVERASSKRHPVVTLRVEAVPLPAGLEYFLSASHWLDATASGVEAALPNLVAAVRRLMRPAAANVDSMSLLSPAAGRLKTRRRDRLLIVAGTVLLLGLALVAADKWWLVAFTKSREPAAAVIPEKSIAVLPFTDMSAKRDQEYFSDGLSEELIDLLTRIPGLHVPARTSSFYFKGRQATIGDIARTLGVAHVLEGSVRKSGNTMRITAQLIRADSGYHVWSQTFDRPLNNVFKVQDEIAAAVVQVLKVSLMGPATPAAVLTTNTDAYDLYLQARALERSGGEGDLAAATSHLQRAVALDPNFAAAWAELVGALLGDVGLHSNAAALPELCRRAHEAANRALALAPALAEGHLSKSVALSYCEQDRKAAEFEIKRALELDPQNVEAWKAYAWNALGTGRLDAAIRYGQKAVSLDPLNNENYQPVAWAQGRAGKFAEAEATYRRAIEFNPTPTPAGLHALHANSLLGLHQPAAALAENALEGDDQYRQMNWPLIYDALGRKTDAEREIAVFERKYGERDPLTVAEFYACRKDADHAIPWLERSSEEPGPTIDVPNRLACLRNIESDPRYKALLLKWRQTAKPGA